MEQKDRFPWELLPWIVVVLSIFNMWRMIFMNISDIPAGVWAAVIGAAATVGAAIIAGAVALIGQWRQAKNDGEVIKGINSDTKDMQPKVGNIDTTVKAMADNVIRIEDRSKQISSIATAVESFKFLKDNTSDKAISPEVLLAQMSSVFEDRARLEAQHKIDQKKIIELTMQKKALEEQYQSLRAEIRIMKREHPKDEPQLTL